MPRILKLIAGLAVLMLVLVAGLYGYRSLMLYEGRTPEGYELLTKMPVSGGFEPKALPKGPVLESRSNALSVDFGYRVGGISYSYSLVLSFPERSDEGKATLTVRHATRTAAVDSPVTRRWDAPRNAYAVALKDKFEIEPAVPSLCIKAVIGPQRDNYDLKDASLCVAQRDAAGNCHPETLACGLIRK